MPASLHTPVLPDDARWMQEALTLARAAADVGEVPVGAVVVRAGQIVGQGYNQPIASHDPTAHAEVMALRDAAKRLGNYRLDDCTLYVTLEPCAMCAGALLHARIARVVWGANEPKTGAGGSVLNLFANSSLNHHTHTTQGVLADAAAEQLGAFFTERRVAKQRVAQANHPLRDDALRTPEKCFFARGDCAGNSFFYSNWPSLQGLRLHVKDSGAVAKTATTWLLLGAAPAPQGLFRTLADGLIAQGDRVVTPDWLGFGRSDKPKKDSALTDAQQQHMLLDMVDKLALLDAGALVVVGHGDASRHALALVRALQLRGVPGRQMALWLINPLMQGAASKLYIEWLTQVQRKPQLDIAKAVGTSAMADVADADRQQWQTQFPDKGYRAGLRAWARDAQQWIEGDAAAVPAGLRHILLSWGEQALWWPAVGGADSAAQQHCSGGDWLPLQNPQALLSAAQRFRAV